MQLVCDGPIAQGSSDTYSYFFIATGLKRVSAGGGDNSEDITVHHVSMNHLDEFLDEQEKLGKMIDPKIFTPLYFYHRR
jgi:ADP-ribose pyrophosphatase